MRVVIRAGFDRFSPDGMDAIDLAVNLEKAGVDVLPMPTSVLPGLPRSFTALLEKDPAGPVDVTVELGKFGILASVNGMARHCFVASPADRVEMGMPVTVLPHGVDLDWPQARRDPATPTTFLTLSDSLGLRGMIGVESSLLVRGPALLNRAEVVALYQSADVLVLLSGEESSRVAEEFMATGGTVISENVGEAQNWLHPDVAYPLDTTTLGNALRWCVEHKPEVSRKGALAAQWIRQTHGWPVVADKMIRVLEGL